MRIASAWSLVLLAAAAAVCAAPVAPPGSAKSATSQDPEFRKETLVYARTIAETINHIEIAYVRPVSRADLTEAALAGLYEAAGVPTPANLRTEIKNAAGEDVFGLFYGTRVRLGPIESLRKERALVASMQTLSRVLDPHSGLMYRREFRWLEIPDNMPNTGLEFVGLPLRPPEPRVPGLVQEQPNTTPEADSPPPLPAGPLRIQSVQPGSPAQRAGLRPGDLITRLDNHPPESAEFPALLQRLRPLQPGTPVDYAATVRLTVVRPGHAEPMTVTLCPMVYRPESVFGVRRKVDGSWDYLLDPASRIGYIRLGGIRSGYWEAANSDKSTYGSHREFRDALQSLNASDARGLVLDLRWCPGGYLRESHTIALSLLKADQWPAANEQDRSGNKSPVLFEPLEHPEVGYPIVVLINGETSGGGELIAAALQDYGRAVIAGQRTVGKGSVQELVHIPLSFRLTTRTFLRPSGKNLQRFPDSKPSDDWGIRPDAGRELPLTAEAGRQLKDWWTLQSLRPPGDLEALPLDDPENDPQRQSAVQILRGMMKK